jgi:nucleotide-binding universal stress UspA family protein
MAFKTILVATDFSETSKNALELGLVLAKQFGASLTLVHAWEVPAYAYGGLEVMAMDLTPLQDAARDQLDKQLAEVKEQLPNAKGVLKHGSAWREILSMIEETKPDLVVLGTHGRRGVLRALLGSVAEKIVRTSPSPVLTVGPKC